ncbi:hypothetical protein DL93DRAFT_140777 [Clavulina sp. PMI_390]|nr:hypothetical protein DL93DRAFT_140777 [Clavulina sp. PMI_390]
MPASTRTSTNSIGAAASSDVFSTLPYDIHLAIASHIDPLSIVALTKVRKYAPFSFNALTKLSYLPQTSKALHALLAHSLAVWRNSVQLQAFRDGIAPFSFPINSMTIEELVQHCARQLQLRSLIHKASTWPSGDFEDVLSKDNLPMRFRISQNSDFKLSDDNDRSDYSAKPIQFTKLLPGGRWLVGCMQHHRVVRTLCWDLQTCAYGEPILPASFIDSGNQLLETINSWDGDVAAQPRDDYTRVAVLVSYGTADK